MHVIGSSGQWPQSLWAVVAGIAVAMMGSSWRVLVERNGRAMAVNLYWSEKKGKEEKKKDIPLAQDLATAMAMVSTMHHDGAGRETAEGHGKSSPSWQDVLWHAGRRGGEGEHMTVKYEGSSANAALN
ncbi:hypothetical protein EI94DRAFT_1695840 [Lactarius quietus]|nr:hypothetical protein EI94DRAFT_1695840 [Lactarius quietus]